MSSSLLRSKAFWGFTAIAGSIASALTYDKLEAKKIRSAFIAEAIALGAVPLKEGDRERKVNLVLFSEDGEAEDRQKAIFRQYAVDLITKAGIEYQWIGFNAASMHKRYYELKDEKEVKEIPNGQVPEEGESKAPRPTIFTADNFIGLMAASWFGRPAPSPSDEVEATVRTENNVMPASKAFFEDGIVALDPATFRAILWAYSQAPARQDTAFGLINCDYPAGFFKRIYMVHTTSADCMTHRIFRDSTPDRLLMRLAGRPWPSSESKGIT